jgi:DNA repair protein RecN (Recombination protein N)
MLSFQVDEVDTAKIVAADEDDHLALEEERLADARAHRDAAAAGDAALSGDGGATDALGAVIARLAGHSPLNAVDERLRAVAIELGDIATDLRSVAESLEDDPVRLAAVRDRRQLLRQLRRKYGETLADVLDYCESARQRLAELDSFDEQAARLEQERDDAARDMADAEVSLGRQRRAGAPQLASAVELHLRSLAMPKARIEVLVGDGPAGEDVTWLLSANPGEPARPLAKVASGGELARTMLAVRLVLGRSGSANGTAPGAAVGAQDAADGAAHSGAATLVFDEVDAGIGGEAALAVGRALADLARRHQVLVVTHLPQVAAFADQQIAVYKDEIDGRTVATVQRLDDHQRIIELSRMLSGQPDSAAARRHAKELLALAQKTVAGI